MRQLNWFSHRFIKQDGYGRFNFALIRALRNQGLDIHPQLVEMLDTPGWFQQLVGINHGWLNLSLTMANEIRAIPGRQWAFSMFEASEIPYEYVDPINTSCERLIVPCQQNAEAFKRGGVSVPIHIIPGGVDPAEFPLLPNVERNRPYTFLALGDRGERKGWELAMMAFCNAFPEAHYPDVRLIVKARPHMMPLIGNGSHNDRRITFWLEDCESMREVYEAVDCFIYGALADGWGMPGREGACMGVPVIAPRHSGMREDVDCWAIPLEKFTEQRARTLDILTLPSNAVWWVPDWREIGEKMKWCYEHQSEARAKGQAAAQWLRENQTWDHSAKAFIKLIEEWA
jgi:glycosyltransferase involved in cell wall biosynthesis